LIKYLKSVLWIVAKRLSYIEDASSLKVNIILLSVVRSLLHQTLGRLHCAASLDHFNQRRIKRLLWHELFRRGFWKLFVSSTWRNEVL